MSKITEKYKELKSKEKLDKQNKIERYNKFSKSEIIEELEKENKLYLFKTGIFYILLEEDAEITGELLDLKITFFTNKTIKTGFPITSLEKYTEMLKNVNNNYTFEIIDINNDKKIDNQTVLDLNRNIAPNTLIDHYVLQEIITDLRTIDLNNISVKKAYEYLNSLKSISSIS